MVTAFFADSGSVSVGGTEFKAEVSEISVGGGERDIDVKYTFGDSFETKDREAPLETTISLVKQDTDLARYVLGGSPVDTTWPITYSGDTAAREKPDIKYSFYQNTDGTGSALRICFSGAYGTSKSMSIESEGHLSEEITFKCLAKNYSEQWTPDAVGSPLV